MNKLIFILLVSLTFFSCKKKEGEGGFASIEGKLFVKNYDAFFQIKTSENYLPGENIYIIYGGNSDVGNSVKTSFDGYFKFNFLQKGTYKIFAVGKDSSVANRGNKISVIKEITISSKKQKIDIGDLVILN